MWFSMIYRAHIYKRFLESFINVGVSGEFEGVKPPQSTR